MVMNIEMPTIMDPAHDARLCQEAIADIAVTGPIIGGHFDSHGHVEVVVVAEPHCCERSGADPPYQPVPAPWSPSLHSRPHAIRLRLT